MSEFLARAPAGVASGLFVGFKTSVFGLLVGTRVCCEICRCLQWNLASPPGCIHMYFITDVWKGILYSVTTGGDFLCTVFRFSELPCGFITHQGGMGLYFFKNATAGGDWIIQERLDNDAFVSSLLPDNAPLSTMRVISASRLERLFQVQTCASYVHHAVGSTIGIKTLVLSNRTALVVFSHCRSRLPSRTCGVASSGSSSLPYVSLRPSLSTNSSSQPLDGD